MRKVHSLATEPTEVLLIAGGELFPNGTGATARMRAYARGLHLLGVQVRVLLLVVLRPESWPHTDSRVSGEWSGVPFEYMSGLARGQRGYVRRRLREARAIWRTAAEILRPRPAGQNRVVILIATRLRWILPVAAACRLARVQVVHDRTEFPFVYSPDAGVMGRFWRRCYVAAVFRLFDGLVVISTHLEDFLRTRVRRSAWVLRIPILVDADAFDCSDEGTRRRVGYAGSLCHSEELEQLIHAVSIVRRNHPGTLLRVIGGRTEDETTLVRTLASQYGIDDAVELTGFARADEIPALLCGCAALALPRAGGLFSTAGMPTKLGEYLATGRPVVVTATGDIPKYLHDGVEAFVVEPGDVHSFSEALERALYNPVAAEVGRAGQRLARREFDTVVHMRRLLETIEATR